MGKEISERKAGVRRVRPLGEWVLCEAPRTPTHEGGIWLPDQVRDMEQTHANVVAVGEKVRDLKAGDVILVRAGLGKPVQHEGRECVLVKHDDYQVLGIIEV